MPSLKFKQLLILSHTKKSGNRFTFQTGLNLITANDNSFGKSTLAKLLFWGMGCDPVLDEIWKKLDCRTIVEFSIESKVYSILRRGDSISLKEDEGDLENYTKISGDYAKRLAELVGFHVLLPNQKTKVLETPPPAYYFLPFYIDQIKGWSTPWDSFDKLGQYSSWKETVVKYHVGLLTPEYFEKEQAINNKKLLQDNVGQAVNKLENALEIVEPYIAESVATIDEKELEEMGQEIQTDLAKLSESQELVLDQLSKLEYSKASLIHQSYIAQGAISELDKDYTFAVENLQGGIFECPLCGVQHDNSILNRAGILSDKQAAIDQFADIEATIAAIDIKIIKAKQKIQDIRGEITEINDKYIINEEKIRLILTR